MRIELIKDTMKREIEDLKFNQIEEIITEIKTEFYESD